ncbi:MAG: hypothetical protein AVDCRST_MAG19-4326 [uncultured Thermomicrobiales bacterium]|uniref:Uncharacterized protein n=1 Tax=uncultured Thermomicrobiales bacterium TaxID=1645740 RepID=A0A6J4VQ31_9BACT|nr:MAG: hypothetical protein AVDCRST_MAG19-4326 [uncultured Thermomicrobiales bacterium]
MRGRAAVQLRRRQGGTGRARREGPLDRDRWYQQAGARGRRTVWSLSVGRP